uniref:Uncharacterized protein n=1 Tax=Arundo donax TaxID=35708 RepID=A0A0A9BBS4_ARUDO
MKANSTNLLHILGTGREVMDLLVLNPSWE